MSDRLEKLFTLTDIDNLEKAPVTIEAGGLIKDNKTGRIIARMYLKNCSDRPLSSVLVMFRPKGENGKLISGMRDYLYDASGTEIGEIFGDQTGILFDNPLTKSFSADIEEVDFDDGEYWNAVEVRIQAEAERKQADEEKRKADEEARLKAEEDKRIAEEARLAAEEGQRIAEEARQAAEESRRIAEESQKIAEQARLAAEAGRREAEEDQQRVKEEARQAEEERQ